MNGFALDTHIWLWVQKRNLPQLKPAFLDLVESWQREGIAYLSSYSIWEVAMLVAHGNLELGSSIEEFVEEASADGGLKLLPLTPRILIESTRLPGTIHRDPADRMLVATAREHDLTLVTRDSKLLDYAGQGYLRAYGV